MAIDRRHQRAYWDANLDTRNLSAPGVAPPDLDEEIRFLSSPEYVYALQRLGDPAGRRILEIGAGLGVNALALARAGATVWALDVSLERLRALGDWARREGLAHRIVLVQGAIEAAPFRDGGFDRAFTKSVLIHTGLDGAGAETARVLRPDGWGVFIEPARYNPFVWLYRRLFAPAVWRTIAEYFDADRWRRFCKPFAGHDRRPFFLFGFLAFVWQFARRDVGRFERSVRRWDRADAMLFRLAPPLRGLRWMDVVVAWKSAPPPRPAGDGSLSPDDLNSKETDHDAQP